MALGVILWTEAEGGQRMPRKGHSEEQIVYAIRQVEAGKKVSDICREMGVSAQAFYNWKRRYAGVGVSELRELRQLRDENRQLKSLVADLTLDKHILQGVLSKRSEARGAPGTGATGTTSAPSERAARLRADRNNALVESLSEPKRFPNGAPSPAARARR
jgi:putative transposase